MKILGLDYGTKNIGIALSDPFQSIAFPWGKAENSKIFEKLEEILKEEHIDSIVLGMPLNMKGLHTKATEEVIKFKKELEEKIDLLVIFQDERLSSVMVDKSLQMMDINTKKRRQIKDALEATQILQSYLDKKNAQKNN